MSNTVARATQSNSSSLSAHPQRPSTTVTRMHLPRTALVALWTLAGCGDSGGQTDDDSGSTTAAPTVTEGTGANTGNPATGDAGTTGSPGEDPGSSTQAAESSTGDEMPTDEDRVFLFAQAEDSHIRTYELTTDGTFDLQAETAMPTAMLPIYMVVQDLRLYVIADADSTLSVFDIDPQTGSLSLLAAVDTAMEVPGQQEPMGRIPVYVDVDPQGEYVATSNFTGTTSLFALAPDGTPSLIDVQPSGGRSHAVRFHPTLPLLYTTSVSQGSITTFEFDAQGLALDTVVADEQAWEPRHLDYSDDYSCLFSANERPITMLSFRVEDDGALTPVSELGYVEVPEEIFEIVSGAEVQVAPDRNLLVSSLRYEGEDADPVLTEQFSRLQTFSYDPQTCEVTHLDSIHSGGRVPRGFVLDPTGQIAVALNQYTGNINTFEIADDGSFMPIAELPDAGIGSGLAIAVVPAEQ